MKVGVNLLNFGPGATPDSLSRWTEVAETLGYHLVMISDHVAGMTDRFAMSEHRKLLDPHERI